MDKNFSPWSLENYYLNSSAKLWELTAIELELDSIG